MAKRRSISIREADRDEFQRLASNTRAKLRRLEKRFGEEWTNNLKGKVYLPDSVDSFKTREAFNKWKSDMFQFTNPANRNWSFFENSKGVIMSRMEEYQLREANANAIRANRRKEREARRITKGKDSDLVQERPSSIINEIALFDPDMIRDRDDIGRRLEGYRKKSDPKNYDRRARILKENFITRIQGTFNSEADELVKEFRKMNDWDFYNLFLSESEVFNFEDYTSDGNLLVANFEALNAMIQYTREYKSGGGGSWGRYTP